MRQINGVSPRRSTGGACWRGICSRAAYFKAIRFDADAYLMSVCRYVERYPVAAGLVAFLASAEPSR